MLAVNQVLWSMHVFDKSPFFKGGTPFHLLGVQSESTTNYVACCTVFFVNSLLSVWNTDRIKPMLSLRNAPAVAVVRRLPVYALVVVFELLRTLERFISFLGLLSNVDFFVATALGYLMAAVVIDLFGEQETLVEIIDAETEQQCLVEVEQRIDVAGPMVHRRRGRRASVWTPFATSTSQP